MSWSGDEDPFEKPSEWFTHIDESEEAASGRFRWRGVVSAVATLTILLLVLVSVVQAVLLHERRNELPDSEFERTAVLFGTSLLQRRSSGQALIFATEGAERDVQEIMLTLSNSPAPPDGAGLAVRPAPCIGIDMDVEQCYEAVLIHQSAEVPPGIYFGLARVDDEPRVVFVRSTLQSV